MFQLNKQPGLIEKTLPLPCGQGTPGNLDGHPPAGVRIMPEKDSAEPTFADDLHDRVFADPRRQALTRRAARILMSTVRPGCKIIDHGRIANNKLLGGH